MTITLRLFGVEVLSVEVSGWEFEEVEDSPAVGGGSSHNFTLAGEFIDERFLPWEEDRVFGFKP